jgi:hypothetical protein
MLLKAARDLHKAARFCSIDARIQYFSASHITTLILCKSDDCRWMRQVPAAIAAEAPAVQACTSHLSTAVCTTTTSKFTKHLLSPVQDQRQLQPLTQQQYKSSP